MRIIAKLSVLTCMSLAVSQLALAQFSGGGAPASTTNAQRALAANEAGIAAYKKRDFTTAAKQFEVACNGGLTMGCYNLANRYYLAEGVPSNKPYALQVYIKSCNSGIAEACSAQGAMTEMGEGIPANPAAARNLYARACQGGYQPACKHSAPVAQNARPTVNVAQKRVPQTNRIAQSTSVSSKKNASHCLKAENQKLLEAPRCPVGEDCLPPSDRDFQYRGNSRFLGHRNICSRTIKLQISQGYGTERWHYMKPGDTLSWIFDRGPAQFVD